MTDMWAFRISGWSCWEEGKKETKKFHRHNHTTKAAGEGLKRLEGGKEGREGKKEGEGGRKGTKVLLFPH